MEDKKDVEPNLSLYFEKTSTSCFDDLTYDGTDKANSSNLNNVANILPKSSDINSSSSKKPGGRNTPFYISECFRNSEFSLDDADTQQLPDEIISYWPLEEETLDPPSLTLPGIQTEHDLPDEIGRIVIKYLGETEFRERKIMDADSVTQDEWGLRTLIEAGCYRAAANLTSRLLTVYGQGYGRHGQPTKHSPHSLQLWFTRLALLIKIGAFDLLQMEATCFEQLQKPDIFYQFYAEKYENKSGSIACFSFRLLLAELPTYSGNAQESLNRLTNLYKICQRISQHFENQPAALAFWKTRELRVLYATVNCALSMRQYNLVNDIINNSILSSDRNLSKEEKRMFYSAWGRIYLLVGDIFGAEQKFAEARRLRDINSGLDLQDLVDKGLITMAKKDFPEAFITFKKALQIDYSNTTIFNNMGVCLLYAGKLKEAINLFEYSIENNVAKSLDENLLINLATLYELESNNSEAKKLKLLRLINRNKPDIRMSLEICLKLQSHV